MLFEKRGDEQPTQNGHGHTDQCRYERVLDEEEEAAVAKDEERKLKEWHL